MSSKDEPNWLKAWCRTVDGLARSSTEIVILTIGMTIVVGIFSLGRWRMDHELALKQEESFTTVVEETILGSDGKPVKTVLTTTKTPPEAKR